MDRPNKGVGNTDGVARVKLAKRESVTTDRVQQKTGGGDMRRWGGRCPIKPCCREGKHMAATRCILCGFKTPCAWCAPQTAISFCARVVRSWPARPLLHRGRPQGPRSGALGGSLVIDTCLTAAEPAATPAAQLHMGAAGAADVPCRAWSHRPALQRLGHGPRTTSHELGCKRRKVRKPGWPLAWYEPPPSVDASHR